MGAPTDLATDAVEGHRATLRGAVLAPFVAELGDPAIEAVVGHVERVSSPFSGIPIEHHGGSVGRVPEAATAFRHRGPEHETTAPSGEAAFGPNNYGRLAALTAEHDPDDVFALNHNVVPAA